MDHPAPAWTYQPPQRPAAFPRQCYYRTDGTGNYIVPGNADGSRLQLFRFSADEHAALTIEVQAGLLNVICQPLLLAALRNACNDALADIAHAEADRERREAFASIQEELRNAADQGGSACYYAHPDVHYVPDAAAAEAKLRELEVSGAERYIVLVDPYADAPAGELLA